MTIYQYIIQRHKHIFSLKCIYVITIDIPETLAILGTQDTWQRQKKHKNITKHKTKKMRNMDPTKNRKRADVLARGKQILSLIRHLSCVLCIILCYCWRLMLGLMLPTWLLSMWISNTATTAMMIPIANAILEQLKTANRSKVADEDKGI